MYIMIMIYFIKINTSKDLFYEINILKIINTSKKMYFTKMIYFMKINILKI